MIPTNPEELTDTRGAWRGSAWVWHEANTLFLARPEGALKRHDWGTPEDPKCPLTVLADRKARLTQDVYTVLWQQYCWPKLFSCQVQHAYDFDLTVDHQGFIWDLLPAIAPGTDLVTVANELGGEYPTAAQLKAMVLKHAKPFYGSHPWRRRLRTANKVQTLLADATQAAAEAYTCQLEMV